jgi:hypothetical protein
VLAVTGAAEFQGGTIRFVFTDGFVPTNNDAIEFLTADGGVSFDPARTALEFVEADPRQRVRRGPFGRGIGAAAAGDA